MNDKHDPLCSEGEVRGDQVMDCDCAELIHQTIPERAETEPRLNGDEGALTQEDIDWMNAPMGPVGSSIQEQMADILKASCDRTWSNETPLQVAHIAANAIQWRDRVIAHLRHMLGSGNQATDAEQGAGNGQERLAPKAHSHRAPEPASAEKKQ